MNQSHREGYEPGGEVSWIEELPAGWDVCRLGFVSNLIVPMRDKPKDLRGEIPWVRIEDFDGKYISGSKSEQGVDRSTIDEMNLKIFPRGSVLCTCSCNMGATAIAAKPLVTNQTFIGIEPRSTLQSEYLYYLLQIARQHLQALATGAIQQYLSKNDFASLRLPLPPLPTQRAIAIFLDRETEKIDTLIGKKRRLLELLEERRTALITRSVTRGIDPDTPMKDSGVEWIGVIPQHWEVTKIGLRFSVQLGKMLDQSRITGEHLYPYLRVADVQWNSINTDDLPEMDFSPADQSRYRLEVGDLLVNEGGSYVGRSAIWQGGLNPCFYQKALHRVRPRTVRDSTRFLYYIMRFATEQGVFVAGGNQTTIDHLTAEQLRRYRFAFPPPSEQEGIADFLDKQSAMIERTSDRITHAISLLQEYRTALISAVVTGQIDVRDKVPA